MSVAAMIAAIFAVIFSYQIGGKALLRMNRCLRDLEHANDLTEKALLQRDAAREECAQLHEECLQLHRDNWDAAAALRPGEEPPR